MLVPSLVTIPNWDGGDSTDPTQPGMTAAVVGSGASAMSALTEIGSGSHYVRYRLTSAPVLGQPYTFSARVQAGSRANVSLQIQSYGVRYAEVPFDLMAGTAGASTDGATGTITPVSGKPGTYDVSVTGTFTSGSSLPNSGEPYVAIITTNGPAAAGVAIFVNSIQLLPGTSTPTP
ncbi:MAG TPA: PKD domain-containing protein [Anaeromyxobacteraceae bacterium]|nr:PKD domain-containing protein [Anaeromyxobacteraceae bacterium]